MKIFKNYLLIGLLLMTFGAVITSCDDDEPEPEETVEIITDVTLVFTAEDGSTVRASASDPDGAGAGGLEILDEIDLSAETSYTLTFEILNGLEEPAEDIGEEIEEEDDEHQFFFAFTTDAFSDPEGNGNIDTASDSINYNDTDDNGCNVGLSTDWTTAGALSGGEFRVRLQHQPDVKTCTTGSTDGDTDFDLTFVLNIE